MEGMEYRVTAMLGLWRAGWFGTSWVCCPGSSGVGSLFVLDDLLTMIICRTLSCRHAASLFDHVTMVQRPISLGGWQ